MIQTPFQQEVYVLSFPTLAWCREQTNIVYLFSLIFFMASPPQSHHPALAELMND